MEASIPESWLDVLDEAVRHRGPDGAGWFRERVQGADGAVVDVALVHRRLSIIDIEGGHQPMVLGGAEAHGDPPRAGAWGSDEAYRATRAHGLKGCPRCAGLGRGRVAVVFNGCIYNHRELRRELEGAGHVFSTDHSDTEVLVHGWGEWGWLLGQRTEAMQATLIWDSASLTLSGFRDEFGEKPLYYWHDERHTLAVFASTAGAICEWMKASGREPAIDRRSLQHWIGLGWATCATPVAGCVQVAAGGLKSFPYMEGKGDPRVHSLPWPERRPVRAEAKAISSVEETDDLIRRAVRRRLEADVPIGCFLSGGVDSSLVAWHAARELGGLTTLTVRMPSAAYDESAHAARAAEVIGSRHEVLECEAEPARDLPVLISQIGLPFGDSSLLPTTWVSRAARRVMKVVLTGDGGDEMFAGYERQRMTGVLRWLRTLWPLTAAASVLPIPEHDPKSRWSKLSRLLAAGAWGGYEDLVSVFPLRDLHGLLRWSRVGRHEVECGAMGREYDARCYLPGDLMRKADAASMSVALEARAPFLDRDLAGAALATPMRTLTPGGERKGLLRAAARRHFPSAIIDRPKMGFAIPIGEWFRTDYGGMRQLLMDHLNSSEPFGPDRLGINAMVDMGFVRRMIDEHDAAGEKSIWPWKGRDHSQRLYMVLVLSIWARWLGGLGASSRVERS